MSLRNDASPAMWFYWRNKRGSASAALESDYPNMAVTDPQLALALAQIKNAELAIDAIMATKESS